ncbi:RagB/SusD family nutrient uptake outer membrane protein [Plebeiibacterium marinum]|uniref:RagB/SusD family nutrient uptake outer membrane protein n=1 Tax=Plebeiibacterium marinum TaxID=2992111 RepID=A0AAE3MDG9_9BACT|nr:RagB/SusD family nutrient uptake outer membrane protein [Plebeiobacterium marinum]MCW3805572.1 RagB/SusD family nutrient uptake outer membrane protein [Plebeiobacterium marinum]
MKRIIYYLSIILTLGVVSCEDDFLETSSPSKLSSETVYQTASMAEAAVMGLYGKMTDTYIYGQKLSVNWQGVTDIESNREFNNTTYNSTSRDEGAGNYYDDQYNRTTRWQSLFEMAELASTAVDGFRNSPILESAASQMKPMLGEALTLRAMVYFELVRYWGDVPFKTESSKSDLSNVYMSKTDRDTIYKYLVADLQEAVDYVPWLGDNTEYGTSERISKGYVKGLLAKVALFAGGWSLRDGNLFESTTIEHHPTIPESGGYFVGRVQNWREYYAIAAQQCAEVIGSDDNPHQLDPDYENIWKTVCAQQQNASNENLFEVAFGMGNNGDIGSLMGYSVASNTKYGARGFGGSYVTSTAYYFYSFDREDTRRDVTLTWRNYSKDNIEELSNNPLGVTFAKWRIYWTSDAYLALHKTANSRIATGINWILMRYSDIYLMFAEAEYALNGSDNVNATAKMSARQALEKVRERAFGAGSSKIQQYDADFFEAIVNERAWEFGCESIRKQDLVRWGLLYDKIEDMKKAICLMLDHTQQVQIFDKTYQPSDFPETVYYRYADDEYIDPSSINYYEELGASPGADYESVDWFPKRAAKPEEGTSTYYIDWPVKTLLAGTGMYAHYDYSSFLGTLSHGDEIATSLSQYSMGNNICNYRHFYAIYYEDIYESKGKLTNSYGY